ncbi:hypothetical protein HW555_007548, partial [Spodoptera exigua]
TSPAVSSVARERINSCSRDEFSCSDGTCISVSSACDGITDCPGGEDEQKCLFGSSGLSDDLVLHRSRRQSTGCRCQPNWFRCTYGACVDGTAPCNNKVECADQSDELLPRCRNETDETRGQFRCLNGGTIPSSNHCDGTPDCPDGSDETVRACAAKTCPSYLFQCAYGACVDQGADCNGIKECADGSDESEELCNRQLPSNPSVTTRPLQSGKCILPPYPDHGTYVVSNAPYAVPGQGFQALQLTVTCRPGYGVLGTDIVFCQDGTWSNDIPKCVRYCKLDPHPSVHYHCLVSGTVEGQRKCNTYEPTGTVVRPECNSPNYYSTGILPFMRCIDGSWDYVAVCTPGLPKNGKNITILIKDTIEVYVHDFVYGSGQSSQPDKVKIDLVTKKDSVNVNEVDSTASPMDYEISEDDWRMGAPQRPETKRKDTGL